MTWKSDLQYDYTLETKEDSINFSDVTNILDKISAILKDGLTSEIPDLSSLLVTKLSGLDQNLLIKVHCFFSGGLMGES